MPVDLPLVPVVPLPAVPLGRYVVPTGAFEGGTGTLNGLLGVVAIFGADGVAEPTGFTDGFKVGLAGVGLAGAGFATGFATGF